MDYFAAFDISATGLVAEKTKLDVVALNLANANTTKTADGTTYRPLRVITASRSPEAGFKLGADFSEYLSGVEVTDIQPTNVKPRLVLDPGHPDANEKGFVEYPNINPVSEMVSMIEATRSYEANVRAINAAKSMALSALDIGRSR